MRAIIGARLLGNAAAQPKGKPFEFCDSRLPGFATSGTTSPHVWSSPM